MVYLVVENKFGAAICRGVLAKQCPRVRINVVPVEVTLQRLAVSDGGVQIAAQRVDLSPLRVNAHLMAGACTGTILTQKHFIAYSCVSSPSKTLSVLRNFISYVWIARQSDLYLCFHLMHIWLEWLKLPEFA